MLFLPDPIVDAKVKLFAKIQSAEGIREGPLTELLALDPNDSVGLLVLATIRLEAGDVAGAEELHWRAIHAQPCAWPAYLHLAMILSDQEALSQGLYELGSRKLLMTESDLEDMADSLPEIPWNKIPGMAGLKTRERFALLAEALRQQREQEPAAVTARLRPYRLIHELQEAEDLEPSQVEALLEERASILPLLIGVLRGWVEDIVPDYDLRLVENTLALIGEIGNPSAIADLLEMVTLEEPELSGTAQWAINRIAAQNPHDAARVLSEIVPELPGRERMAVLETLIFNPDVDPKGLIYERLFENFERVDKQDRNAIFKVLLPAAMMLHGRAGLDRARSLLRRHGGVVSRSARRDCEELIEDAYSLSHTSRLSPKPSPWTVYNICNGEVDWEAEIANPDDDDEDDMDDFLPPEPVRRVVTPGRNDPCWCGSGRKYKKCHLEADEQKQREAAEPHTDDAQLSPNAFDRVRRAVGQMLTKLPIEESRTALTEFFGEDKMGDQLSFIDWMVHDRVSAHLGRTVMEEYLHRNGSHLTEPERHFLESCIRSYIDLYEVQQVEEGTGVHLKSLTSGEAFFGHDVSMSKTLVKWDGVLARVVDGEPGRAITGTCFQVPRNQLETLLSWMKDDRQRIGLDWTAYMKRNWPRIQRHVMEVSDEWLESLRLTNTDGEELVVSKAVYRVIDRGQLIASLRSSVDLDETEEGTSFVWLYGPPPNTGRTILGKIRVVGDALTLECNSKERLKRGKRMLTELAGPALMFKNDEFTAQEEIKRNVSEKPQPGSSRPDDISPELERQVVGQYMERHYAEWPDKKLPALDGKTPRQAVKNAAGKRKVAALLKEFENDAERNRKEGHYAHDFSRLRAELGISE